MARLAETGPIADDKGHDKGDLEVDFVDTTIVSASTTGDDNIAAPPKPRLPRGPGTCYACWRGSVVSCDTCDRLACEYHALSCRWCYRSTCRWCGCGCGGIKDEGVEVTDDPPGVYGDSSQSSATTFHPTPATSWEGRGADP